MTTATPVRMVEDPLWGVDWAPMSRCKLALACRFGDPELPFDISSHTPDGYVGRKRAAGKLAEEQIAGMRVTCWSPDWCSPARRESREPEDDI